MVNSSQSCLLVFRGLGGASSCEVPSEVKGIPTSTGTLMVLLLSSSVRVVSAMLGGLVVWMPLRLLAELLICWISYVICSVFKAVITLPVAVGRRARTV